SRVPAYLCTFIDPAPTQMSTLSLHDALPILSNFASMGANTFNINRFDYSVEWDADNTKINPVISYQQAVAYQQQLDLPYAQTSISFDAAAKVEVKSENRKTDPEATVLGVDDFYFENSGL